jgi:hypothetical protein
VARKRIAADEAARIGRHEVRLLRMHAGPFAVGHARVDLEGGRLGALGQQDGFLGADAPWVAQAQVARVHFQHVGVGQAGAVVFGGEAGDVVGRVHGGAQGGRGKVGSAGIAAFLADVDRHAHAFVFVLLEGLDFALAD